MRPLTRSSILAGAPVVDSIGRPEPCGAEIHVSIQLEAVGVRSYFMTYEVITSARRIEERFVRGEQHISQVAAQMADVRDQEDAFIQSTGNDLESIGSRVCEFVGRDVCRSAR